MKPHGVFFTEDVFSGLVINCHVNPVAIKLNLIFWVKYVIGSALPWTDNMHTGLSCNFNAIPFSLTANISTHVPVLVGKRR